MKFTVRTERIYNCLYQEETIISILGRKKTKTYTGVTPLCKPDIKDIPKIVEMKTGSILSIDSAPVEGANNAHQACKMGVYNNGNLPRTLLSLFHHFREPSRSQRLSCNQLKVQFECCMALLVETMFELRNMSL